MKVTFKINIKTQMFKYIQRYPFLRELSDLSLAFHEKIKLKNSENSGWITCCGLPNLMKNQKRQQE